MSSQEYICLLCCKTFENKNNEKFLASNLQQVLIETPVINSIQKLFKSIGRRSHSARLFDFSNFNQSVKDFDKALPRTGICSDCEIVATAICDLHHEIKCLELRLEWRIEALEGIMKLGGRVPSRVKHLKSHCDEIDRYDKMGENVSYIKIENVRKNLMKACPTKLSNKYPRIVLRKYMKHETDSNSIPVYDKPITEPNKEPPRDFTDAIKKIISLVVISVIGFTTDTRNIRNPDQFDTADVAVAISPDQLNVFVKTDEPSINSVRTNDIDKCSNSFTSIDDYSLHLPVEDGQREAWQSVESTLPKAENLQNDDDDDDCMKNESTEVVMMEENYGRRKLRRIMTCKHCHKTFSNSRSFESHIKQCFGESEMPDCEDDDENQGDNSDIEDQHETFSPVESTNEETESDSDNSFTPDSNNVEASLSVKYQPPPSSMARANLGEEESAKCNMQKADKSEKSKILKSHTCRICKKSFARKEILELHRLSCGKDRSKKSSRYFLTCKLCPGSRFSYPVYLRKHQRQMHPDVNHDDIGPQDSQRLTVDSEMVTEDEPLPCEVAGCKERFSLPQELENHSKMHGQFSCSMCSEVLTFATNLAQHEADEHAKTLDATASTNIQCPRCPFTLNCCQQQGKPLYMKHFLSTHLNLDWATLICAICGVRCFSMTRKKRRRWQTTHFKNSHDISDMNPVDVHKCDQCPANFKNVIAMNQHKRTVHAMNLKCGECGKEFRTRNERRMHLLQVHKARFSFSCSAPGCTKTFPDQDDLSVHIEVVHNHETPNGELRTYKCRECGHISKGKSENLKHVSEHNRKKEKPSFVCEQCGKAFKAKERLQTHKLSHSGPDSWQFCCEICGRKFISKQKLTEHGRTHTKEKPFQCSVCGEKYAHRHNLRNHVNKKHGDVVQDIPRRMDKSNLTSRKRTRKLSQ